MMGFRDDNKLCLENEAPRVDIVEKVTGAAKYTADQFLPEMMWAAYIRSDFGNAKITKIDIEAARAVKGVLDVERLKDKDGKDVEKCRYHGDRLGHVCADSRQALEDGLAALAIEYDISTPKTRLEDERKPAADMKLDNKEADAQKALDESEVVVEAEYQTQVQTHTCLETHGVVVHYKGDSAVAYGSTQSNQGCRSDLAKALSLEPGAVEFHCEYVGGGFGSKFGADSQGNLAAQLSKKFKRPCRVMCSRKEEHLDTGNRPGSIQAMKIGVNRDGKMNGGRVLTWGSVGPGGAGEASGGGGGGGGVRNPSRYKFGTVTKAHQDVNLNGGAPRAFRAPGHPQAMFAIELMIDRIAGQIGMDPLEFRLLNDENDVRKEMLRVGAEKIGWANRKPDGQWPGPIKHGFGVGVGDWGNGGGKATIAVNVYRNGTIEVLSGAQDIGMGYRTLIGDIVRTQLGLPRELLVVKVGRGDYPPGPASGGSVTSRATAPKAFMAAELARDGVLKIVADEWGLANAEGLTLKDGVISGEGKTIDWKKACQLMTDDHLSFSTDQNGKYQKEQTQSQAVHFVEALVDVETGIVKIKRVVAMQNVGLPVNRSTIENQVCGAVIQGISYTLFEDRILNRQTGAMVNTDMNMYKIAGPIDVPEIIPIIWREDWDVGVNCVGEPPAVPILGAVATAVANAVGVQITSMPLTPDKILAALSGKERVT